MKFRNTLITLVILLGLGVYIYFFEKGKSLEEAEEKAKLLVEFEEEKVTGLKLTSNETTIVVCSKDKAGIWHITSPLQTRADESALEDLISGLKGLKATRTIRENIGDWNNYGLASPEIKLTLQLDEGNSRIVYLGNKNPTGTSIYARLPEKDILYLVPAWKKDDFKKDLYEMRFKKVFDFENIEQVKKMELCYPDRKIICQRRETPEGGSTAEWEIITPENLRADTASINAFLWDLQDLEAKEFVAEECSELSVYGLDKPEVQIKLWDKEDKIINSLTLGKITEGEETRVYARTEKSPAIYRIDESKINDFIKSVSDLKE